MLKIYERKNTLRMIISSETSLIRSVVQISKEYLADNYPEQVADLEVVLRELILNAIRHGNNENRNKLININIAPCNFGSLKISVQDEGQGFDLRAVNLDLPANAMAAGNRGLKLVNALSKSLSYDSKENRITAKLGNKSEGFLGLGNLFHRTWEAA